MNSELHYSSFEDSYSALNREYEDLRRAAASVDPITRELLERGLVVIPNFFDGDAIRRFLEASPPVDECQLSPEGTLTRFYLHADKITELSSFFSDRTICDTMRNVLGVKAEMHRAVVQYRLALGHTGAFEQFFHIDTWRPRYKAFLYLTDVDSENGPFTYTPLTHYGEWRQRYDRDIASIFRAGVDGLIYDELSAFVGCLWPHEHARVCEAVGSTPVTVTGSAGTLILFDARGLHKIPPLRRAPRIILSSYWIRQGQHT